MNTSIVILAAGLGTRMRSKHAKVLQRAGGLALIEHVVRAARKVAGPDRIVVVTGHQAAPVEAAVAGHGVKFVRQTEQKGTGHALACCRDTLAGHDGLLLVLYGDVPLLAASTIAQLRDTQAASSAAATVITTTVDDPTGYGRVLVDTSGNVTAIVEHRVCTEEQRALRVINSGIYCFRADLLWRHIGSIQPNPVSGEYYLTDMPAILAAHGHRMRAMHVAESRELLGINTRIELAEADQALRRRKCRELMLAGVTIEQPDTVTIDTDAQVGADTVIEAHARLLGATGIGEDCRIGAGAVLEDMQVENGAIVFPYSVLAKSRIREGAQVGPFARMRPGSDVGPAAHVGNFIELKNTKVGAGAKAPHVGYLGDSEIGPKTNVGAGTIICNYDGHAKHKTHIGQGVFVGSNSTLVAPVEIGDDSYIAAGSVITEQVPADALALGRSRQVVKPEWAKKRRQLRGPKASH
jgi:bifunctional UDP-N-acetylglucosamine pyrophosphorylase/glucosamine-1-phosphate N-acetyltransferase